MDELRVLREFRADIPGPDANARRHALATLRATIEPPKRRPRPRRRLAVLALVAAVLAVALALVPGWIDRKRKVDVIDRALAGVSKGPILHAVLEVPTEDLVGAPAPVRQTNLDLSSGVERPVVSKIELWYDARHQRLHQIESVNGAVTLDALQTRRGTVDSAGGSDTSAPTIEPGLGGFFQGYKRALRDESVVHVGSGVLHGRRVEWLRFPAAPGQYREEVAIDARTHEPLLIRQLCAGCVSQTTYRVVVLEGVRTAQADFSPPVRRNLHQVGRSTTIEKHVTLGRAASATGGPTVWAGPRLLGVHLTAVQSSRVTARLAAPGSSRPRTVRRLGLTLSYGGRLNRWGRVRVRPGERYVTIAESTGGGLRFDGFNLDRANGAVVSPLTGAGVPSPGRGLLTRIEGAPWIVQLRSGSLYVEIEASSRKLALAAARTLRPIPRS